MARLYLLTLISLAFVSAVKGCDEQSVDYSDLLFTGPEAAKVQADFVAGIHQEVMKDWGPGGKNEVNFFFSPTTPMVRVMMRSKFAKDIIVRFYDDGGNLLDTQVAYPANPDSSKTMSSTVIPTGGQVDGVAKINFQFESDYAEWKIKPFEFFRCGKIWMLKDDKH